jgi:hypothetical protein
MIRMAISPTAFEAIAAMPTIDLTDAEHAAVTATIRRAIEEDKFPHAPRLDLLRSALAKLDPAATLRRAPEPKPPPKAPPPARGGKPARRRSPPSFVHRSGPCHHEFNVAG